MSTSRARPAPRRGYRAAVLGGALVLGLGLATEAQAWDWARAPARYVDVVKDLIVVQWPQARLASDCGAQHAEATGRTILGCSWVMGSVCFVVVWDELPAWEARQLVRYHEAPHCAGWSH